MAPKIDKRLEALKELGAMIAEDYSRRMANGHTIQADTIQHEADSESGYNFEVTIQIHDPDCDGLYTETVKVENFLRNKISRRLIGRSKPKTGPKQSATEGLKTIRL
jgi:hypothetical protein